MRKMRCPHCAVINLEGFITFPQCAGCGATLPPLPPVEEKAWRSPLRTALWTSVVGGVLTFAAILATRALAPTEQSASRIVLGARPTLMAVVGRPMSLLLTLAEPGREMASEESFRALKVRVPRDFFRNFRLVALQPPPDAVETRGGGFYYFYRELPSGTQPRFLLMPLRPGDFKLEMKLFADNQFQNQCRVTLDVAPPATD